MAEDKNIRGAKNPEESAPEGERMELRAIKDIPKSEAQAIEKDTVTMNKQEYMTLLNRVSNLEKGVIGDNILDEPAERHVWIRTLDGQYVTNYGIITSRMDEKGDEVQFITLELTDGEKTQNIEVRYLDYIQRFDKVKATIVERKVKNEVSNQGHVEKKVVDGYKTVNAGFKVPARVVTPQESFVVQLPDGRQLELNEKVIN